MPVGVMLKRAATAALVVAATIAVSGCASADHSWRGEFDARLEGASAAIEEHLGALGSKSTEIELFRASQGLGHELAFKSELIKGLDPPDGCEVVQEEGLRNVGGLAEFSYDLPKNLTPELHRALPHPFEEAIAEYKELEREAESCASG
jgi:hypothetical protein